jgi:hypothetical protein
MSGFMSVDHHANFAGWAEQDAKELTKGRRWAGLLQALCFLGLCTVSWLVVISAVVLFD